MIDVQFLGNICKLSGRMNWLHCSGLIDCLVIARSSSDVSFLSTNTGSEPLSGLAYLCLLFNEVFVSHILMKSVEQVFSPGHEGIVYLVIYRLKDNKC